MTVYLCIFFFFFQAEDGIRDLTVTGVQTCALPISDALTEGPRLLFLGRIEPRNGLGTALAALPRILARYPNAVLTVAGDGPWRGYYERRGRGAGAGGGAGKHTPANPSHTKIPLPLLPLKKKTT